MQLLPSTLCRYRSVSEFARARTQRVVETGLHYFAAPPSFNDPFDCRPNFVIDGTEAAVREYLVGMWARQAPHLPASARQAEVNAILNDPSRDPRIADNNKIFAATYDSLVTSKVGVLCLSEVYDDILMWSHYADCHRGICLVYDTSYEFFAHAQPVRYQIERPVVNPVAQSTEQMLDNAIFTKSHAWAYEKEWRILHYRQGVGERQSPQGALKAIILGVAISNSDRKMVESWARVAPSKPSVLRAVQSSTAFSVNVPRLQ